MSSSCARRRMVTFSSPCVRMIRTAVSTIQRRDRGGFAGRSRRLTGSLLPLITSIVTNAFALGEPERRTGTPGTPPPDVPDGDP
ncbi:hypothetical protein GCM10023082_00410 [Streptomyces tremellae]|uniref:Uncharacterized protein n=1 Tax=Streptomyces tremellae TaxID=1124239 RepID=A0ABP7DM33_9ACTN